MRDLSPNHYERAFESWLVDNRIKYVRADEYKNTKSGKSKIKSFDFLVYPPNQKTIIAEVKGRRFKGSSFENLKGFECWVTAEDVDGLSAWQQIYGEGHSAVFVFTYRIESVDVDYDGRAVYVFEGGRYVFFAVRLGDYRKFMRRRSGKWKTITLPADKFRRCALQMQELLF